MMPSYRSVRPMTVNTGSRRVMEKIGLRFIRTFHLPWPETIEGTEFGDVEYALTRSQWQEGVGAGEASRRNRG